MLFARFAVTIAGFAAGQALVKRWQAREAATPAAPGSLDGLARQMQLHEARLDQLETRVVRHAVQLRQTPTAAQMQKSMDDLLTKAMTGLDRRLTAQKQSIETLQATVRHTDELLEHVLESLDLLQSGSEPAA